MIMVRGASHWYAGAMTSPADAGSRAETAAPLGDFAPSEAAAPRRRRDAQRNRETFVAVAQAAFAERGADASLEQIARDAGLAIGTLYRHFPTRIDLLLATYEPRVRGLLAEAEKSLEMDDAWEGFLRCMEALFSMQAGDRGFNDLISTRCPGDPRTEAMHNQICGLIRAAIERAQASGDIRPDVTDADVVTLVWANGRIVEATSGIAPRAWRRHVHLMMDAFRAVNRHELPEPPLTDEQLYQAMAHRST